ncbi:hypothetical protein DFJ73DRAFT_587138 [Zopfochytrium polystomum]|nr:hypothetical protein DFJ73DRAFT_587138 [Zopfochytrium polystomum]
MHKVPTVGVFDKGSDERSLKVRPVPGFELYSSCDIHFVLSGSERKLTKLIHFGPSWKLPLTDEDRLVDVSNYTSKRLDSCGFKTAESLTFFAQNDQKQAALADRNLLMYDFLKGVKDLNAKATTSPKTLMLAVRVVRVNSQLAAVVCPPETDPPMAASSQVVDQLVDLASDLKELSDRVKRDELEYSLNARDGAVQKIAEVAEIGLNGFDQAQKAAGLAKDVFSRWEETFQPVLSVLNVASDVASAVPIIGIACSGVKKIISVVKAVGENDSALSQLGKSCDLLEEAIEHRVTVYFSHDSDVVVTNDLCINNFRRAMVDATKVAKDVLSFLLSKYKRGTGRRLMDAAGGAEEFSKWEKQIDYAIKSIWVIEPVHYIFHLESASMYLTQPGALRFWKEHRYRYTVDSEEFVKAVVAFAASNISKFKAEDDRKKSILKFSIDKNSDGFVHIREFESWLKGLDIDEAVVAALAEKRSTKLPHESVPDDLRNLLEIVQMSEDLRFHLDAQSADSRSWLVELVHRWARGKEKEEGADRPCLLLCADAGFGKSAITAKLIVENGDRSDGRRPIYFFFKFDDAHSRTLIAMCHTLFGQLYGLALQSDRAKMKEELASLPQTVDSEAGCKRWIDVIVGFSYAYVNFIVLDALDECPPLERKRLVFIIEEMARRLHQKSADSQSPKIVLTSRPASGLLDVHGRQYNFTSFLTQLEKNGDSIAALYLPEQPEKSLRENGSFTPWEKKAMSYIGECNNSDLRDYLDMTFETITDRETEILVKKSNGNFLWLKIAVNIIQDHVNAGVGSSPSIKHVALNFLSRSLPEQYFRSFSNSVKSFSKFQKGEGGLKALMSVILYAEEPFTLEELLYIFSKNSNKRLIQGSANHIFDVDQLGNESRKEFDSIIVYPLYRLLIRVNSLGHVAAGHKSLRDSISRSSLQQLIESRDGHSQILRVCFDLLLNLEKMENTSLESVGTFSNRIFKYLVDTWDSARSYPGMTKNYLSQYAAKYWYVHFQAFLEANPSPEDNTIKEFSNHVDRLLSSRQANYWIYLLCKMSALDAAKTSLSFVIRKLPFLTDKAVAWMSLVDRFADMLAANPNELFRSVAAVGQLHPVIGSFMDKDRDQARLWVDTQLFWSCETSSSRLQCAPRKVEIHVARLHRNTALIFQKKSGTLLRWELDRNVILPGWFCSGEIAARDACLLELTTEEENSLRLAAVDNEEPNVIYHCTIPCCWQFSMTARLLYFQAADKRGKLPSPGRV